jgi:hypothetical protein
VTHSWEKICEKIDYTVSPLKYKTTKKKTTNGKKIRDSQQEP